ncbi:hypothetical protein TGRH88_034800 [Toxoplasma gondii]|uniref:Peptidyl-prolyl cis-trans isomerase n=1 Tax=Toxoplasma gondii TaxID=5811 RepID=A0A7J6K714_TOXGO|nr:hypothetical protein TGRH88_034800 [Toxoplasma gondii]
MFCEQLQHVPKTSAAFLTVAQRGQYDGCPVHRFVPGGWIQAGDVVDGSGGHSGAISASPSPESFLVTHDAAGVLGMCPCATGGTGTQFYVSLKPLAAFDKKFVAIGRSVMGMNALLLLLQRQLVPFDANTQRPAGDALFIKKIDVFID